MSIFPPLAPFKEEEAWEGEEVEEVFCEKKKGNVKHSDPFC